MSAGSRDWQSPCWESPRAPGWPPLGRGICPSLGSWGAQLLLLPLSSLLPWGFCWVLPFSHHFLGNLPLIPGFLWLQLKMEKTQGLGEQELGLGETFLAVLQFAILSYKSFTYRFVRFNDMKYLYFLVICSF